MMKITMINGSPKAKDSASETMLSMLEKYLEGDITKCKWNKTNVKNEELQGIYESDAVIIAFPLYIDSIPSHLLRCLMQAEAYGKMQKNRKKTLVYVLLNNGFFEGKQNIPAIECMEHWCCHCGFTFGGAVGIGGGGMLNFLQTVPEEHGPKKSIGLAFRELGNAIMEGKMREIKTLEPDYPAFLYKMQAEYGWRSTAKQNGLKVRDLDKQW